MREHFRNISRILDCIGCEKCRLHSKVKRFYPFESILRIFTSLFQLQILGIGTALNILLSDITHISRNELIVSSLLCNLNFARNS